MNVSNLEFDYIIVGAGSAGCLLANRLSADPSIRVALIEAGGKDDYVWIHIPVGYLYCIGNPRTDWMFMTEPDSGLNGRSIRYPRGKVWGGCSSINGMIYMRGQKGDFDHWAALGNQGWSWDEVLPYFKKHEDHYAGNTATHGQGGEWRVERQRLSWQILDTFKDAAASVGIPGTDDFNSGDNLGCGYFEVNQKKGVRWNAATAFLKPVLGRSNLKLWSNSTVSKVLLSEEAIPRATGVMFHVKHNGTSEVVTMTAKREVIMAAGAVGTPHILKLSGVGDADELKAHRILPRVHLAGVGENLQDHLQLRTIFKVNERSPTLNVQANSWLGKAMMGIEYALFRRGPMSMSPSQLGAFAKSSDTYASANIEYHVQPLSLDKFGDPLHRFPAMTASVCNLRPTSRGYIRLQSSDPFQAPLINPRFLSTPEDKQVAIDSIRLTRKIMASQAMAAYEPNEYLPGSGLVSDEQLVKASSEIGTTIFHPVGTCKMGVATDRMAVVDDKLNVHGVNGLRIADASVMPTITSGNTNAPTLMIAEKAAEFILRSYK
jgi:choline dehydrogenase